MNPDKPGIDPEETLWQACRRRFAARDPELFLVPLALLAALWLLAVLAGAFDRWTL